MRKRSVPVLVLAFVFLGATALPALAAEEFVADFSCEDGTSGTLVVKNSGIYGTAKLDGNTTVIPVQFGEITFTLFDAEGNVIDQFTEPGEPLKGKRHQNQETVECEFSATFTDDLPPGAASAQIEGEVTAVLKP